MELFVQLLFARLISGDEVKRRRQTSELFALICAKEELVDDATHVHLRLQRTPGLPPAGDAGPHDAAVAAGAAGHRAVVCHRPHVIDSGMLLKISEGEGKMIARELESSAHQRPVRRTAPEGL